MKKKKLKLRFSLTEATTRHCGREPVVGVLKYCNTTHRSFLIIDIHINIIKYCNTTHRSFLIINIHINIIKYCNTNHRSFLIIDIHISIIKYFNDSTWTCVDIWIDIQSIGDSRYCPTNQLINIDIHISTMWVY